jgi:magnesium-transporting ATPase (P-type)
MKKYLLWFEMKFRGIISAVIGSVAAFSFGAIASAQTVTQSGNSTGQTPAISLSGGYDVVTKILCPTFDFMFWILIAVSIIMVIFAAFQYATAGDDTEKTTKGRKTLTWAAVGIAVALLAKGLPTLVGNIYGVSNATGLAACAAF